jgi:hypothetical protein
MPYLAELQSAARPAYAPLADVAPWVRRQRDRALADAAAEGGAWVDAVARLTGYVDKHGAARLPMREVYLQLNVPPGRVLSVSHHVCTLMRAAGWRKRRIGRGLRPWVWERQSPSTF